MPGGKLRREQPADAAAVRRVVVAAFAPGGDGGPPVEAGLLDALRADPGHIDSGWVAEHDGEVIAQVTVVRVRVGGAPALGLGIVSVRPEHQGQGHGTKAIWMAIHDLVNREEPLVVVFGSPAFYGRFGFVPAPVVGVDHPKYPAPYLQALALRVAHPRGAVEYPTPYDALEG